jgi:hypothetical protein
MIPTAILEKFLVLLRAYRRSMTLNASHFLEGDNHEHTYRSSVR